ncbi:MAG: hypothetical protein U1F61_10825 [Opitutaceae bacterium]
MRTFVKLLLVAAIVLLAIKLWPLAVFLLGAVGLILGLCGGLFSLTLGGLMTVLAIGLSVVLVLAIVTSPLWITALAVFGLVALARRSPSRVA